jgi:hypothetical protein
MGATAPQIGTTTMNQIRSINEIVSSIHASHGVVLDLTADRKVLNGAIHMAKIEV